MKVCFGKVKKHLQFSTYEHLINTVEAEWKSLKQFAYEILLKGKNTKVLQPFSDVRKLKRDSTLVIRKLSKGFSKFHDEEEVLSYIGAMMSSSNYFSSHVGDPDFPTICSDVIANENLSSAVETIWNELQLRREVIELQHATEYSMREFISPILISCVKLMIDHLKEKQFTEKLVLSCEKKILGNVYFGPVDYSVVFDCLDIVLTEAKRGSSELKNGILQNILQQRSAKEFLAKVVIDPSLTGSERKRVYEETFLSLVPIPSYGIVSDGSNWIFTKTIYDTTSKKTIIIQSSSYNILPELTKDNIKTLISRILGIIHVQLAVIEENAVYKKFKHAKIEPRERTLGREVTVATEVIQELKNTFHPQRKEEYDDCLEDENTREDDEEDGDDDDEDGYDEDEDQN